MAGQVMRVLGVVVISETVVLVVLVLMVAAITVVPEPMAK